MGGGQPHPLHGQVCLDAAQGAGGSWEIRSYFPERILSAGGGEFPRTRRGFYRLRASLRALHAGRDSIQIYGWMGSRVLRLSIIQRSGYESLSCNWEGCRLGTNLSISSADKPREYFDTVTDLYLQSDRGLYQESGQAWCCLPAARVGTNETDSRARILRATL